MPRLTTGSVFKTADGYGIRWPEDGKRPQRTGFTTKTEARRWFAANVALRLDRGSPSPDITFDGFCDLFLERHGATVSERTRATLRSGSPRRGACSATGRSPSSKGPPTTSHAGARDSPTASRYRLTLALRQTLGAAVRWRYLTRNPAIEAGRNPEPRSEELLPFTPDEVEALALELGPVFGPLVVFAPKRGCGRTSGPRPSAATSTAPGPP